MQLGLTISKALAMPLKLIVRFYQLFISPMLGQNCRFHPTCSCYAHQALSKHGAFKGTLLAFKRIVKCQPMHPGGFDYVPPSKEEIQHPEFDNTVSNKNNVINTPHAKTIKKESTLIN